MNTSLDCYRASIGIWHHVCLLRDLTAPKILLSPIKIKLLLSLILSANGVFIGMLLLMRCGDVHPNPGPSIVLKNLNVCHLNVQSLFPRDGKSHSKRKINEIETILINTLSNDIICISETWLKPQILDSDVDIEGFKIHRKDRLDTISGGVGMYVNDFIPNKRVKEFELPGLEVMWVEIILGLKKILVGAGYRPPKQSVEVAGNFLSLFQESIDLILKRNPESIVLLGDFNDVCKEWKDEHIGSDFRSKIL
jgi:hypothetical protein